MEPITLLLAKSRKARRETPGTPLSTILAEVSSDLLGVPLTYRDEEIDRILSPRHFVEVRRTHGGPSPSETARAIEASRQLLQTDAAWMTKTRDALSAAEGRLKRRSEAL